MSYLVLARKYRPMFFADVLGQQHVTTTLQNAIQQKRIANAYLFSGPRGVGKTTVARLLSKALNCQNGPTTNPCNTCSSCKEINESRSLDVFEIDGASNRGIDEVRNLREGLRYSPNPGKHRIYIIDEVHMLTNEAFNALLKTLEEPPPNVLFVFATTEAHKVPATILSRCQRFDFKRITQKNLIEQLRILCDKEKLEIDEESLRIIAMKADGSMRDAESILDQIIAYAGNSIHSDAVTSLLGIIDNNIFFQVSDLIRQGNVEGGIELTQKIFFEGYDFSEFLTGLAEHFRNFIITKSTRSAATLDVADETAQRYLKEESAFEIEDLLRLIKIVSDTENAIRRSSNPRVHLEVAVVKMIKMSKSLQLSQLLQVVEEQKKKPVTTAAPSEIHATPAKKINPESLPAAKPSDLNPNSSGKIPADKIAAHKGENTLIELEDLQQRWGEIVEYIKRRKIALGSFLGEGWPTHINGRIVEISFRKANEFHMSSIERNVLIVENLIAEILNVEIKVRCKKDEEGILEAKQKANHTTTFADLVNQDEKLKMIVDVFEADLIK